MPAPTELPDVVARFREQHADFKRGAHNEIRIVEAGNAPDEPVNSQPPQMIHRTRRPV